MVVGSTGGGVFSHVARHKFVRDQILEVVADRDCGLLSKACSLGLPQCKLSASDGQEFSENLLKRYGGDETVIILSFYTKLFSEFLVNALGGRIFNCHPSLLPSFKGLNAFDDTMASSALFMGCTIHQVDAFLDSGPSLIQAAYPIDRRLSLAANRHKVFLMQYYTTLQFFKWLSEGRLVFDDYGVAKIKSACFKPSVFSPNLDEDLFVSASIHNELEC